jgi:phosphoribosylamine-glycine ligase
MMPKRIFPPRARHSVMLFGVGSFAHSIGQALRDDGAEVAIYLTRHYGHFSPQLVGPVFTREAFPDPCPLLAQRRVELVIPQSIDWAQAPWAEELLRRRVPIFSPTGEAMKIERERDFARKLCADFGIAFPRAFVASNRLEAEKIVARNPRPFVIKNPLCSPSSPVHTILCETAADTRAWLKQVNYAEGVFLQEYMGRAEAGHIALVSAGRIYSLVTNQEYKRAFHGNMGVIAGAPLGGLVEKDPDDKYGLARQFLHPLLPWFRKVKYNGPIQVTAVKRAGKWFAIEYNIRIGVTSGPMIARLLHNPLETFLRTARNEKPAPKFRDELAFGCSLTLAGYGYPYNQVTGPQLPLQVEGKFDCDVWWNEVTRHPAGHLATTGQRIADVIALSGTLEGAIARAYENMRKIRVLSSYYREDIGRSLWPPGNV